MKYAVEMDSVAMIFLLLFIICLNCKWVFTHLPLRAWVFGVRMRLFCVCVVLCLGSGLAVD
jgi:hypothetical protein